MKNDRSRVMLLVEEALNSGRTPKAVCTDCPELLPDVRTMWERCVRNDVELNELFSPSPPPTLLATSLEEPGSVVGPYTLLRRIGEGGFGTVYLAEQTRPVRRRVALKVIKAGMDTREVIARFDAERQALAMMDHPNIARVFEAGATVSGRPYFVMELVDGVPIVAYCDDRLMPFRPRLELMVLVCRAVQSAHQKGVIHRDLKPSNVLVATQDGEPIPKVIDFGIAKATALTDRTLLTAVGGFVGTPAYMSPEQAESSGLGVDTRTDVYGLGALLYELLTGTPPIDPRTLKDAGPGEIARLILDAEPSKPSTSLSALGGTLTAVAAARGSDPRRLVQLVRGELDWIVMRALEKDRTRRYDTAAALADDLARYLAGEPVAAGPPGRTYRVRKFARKHKVAIGFAASIALALLLGLAGTTIGLVREGRLKHLAEERRAEADGQRHLAEERRAEADGQRRLAESRLAESDVQRRSARAVVAFLTKDILAKASPRFMTDRAVRDKIVQSLIEPSLQTVDQRFGDQLLVRAAVQIALATTLFELGRYDLALPQAKAAWLARQAALGDDDPETMEAMDLYASALDASGHHSEAAPLFRQAWEWRRRAIGDDHPSTINSLELFAVSLQSLGRFAEAEPLARQAWDRSRRVFGDDDLTTIRVKNSYAWSLRNLDRPAEAVPLARQVWERRRNILGDDHPDTNRALDDYSRALNESGHPAKARPLAETAWNRSRRVLGDDHPDTIWQMYGYALTLAGLDRPAEAEPLFRQAWEQNGRVLGKDHWITSTIELFYARTLVKLGRPAEAEPLSRHAWEWFRRVRGDDHQNTIQALRDYAKTLTTQERWAEARPLYGQIWVAIRRARGDNHPETIRALNNYAVTWAKQGDMAAAAVPFADATSAERRSGRSRTVPFANLLFAEADFLRRFGDPAGAVAPLREATDLLRATAPDDPNRGRDLYCLGTCLMAAGRPADAEPVFRENYLYDLMHPVPDRPAMPGSLEGLIASLTAQGKPADARAIRSEFETAAATPKRVSPSAPANAAAANR